MRSYLRGLLGLPSDEKTEAHIASEIPIHTGKLPSFRKGDFFGLSHAEAGYKVLQRAGGSLTTTEILKVLVDSGYSEVGGENPERTLYSSLCRSRKLVLVAPNTFDLAERRPQIKRKRLRKETKEAQTGMQDQPATDEKEEKSDSSSINGYVTH